MGKSETIDRSNFGWTAFWVAGQRGDHAQARLGAPRGAAETLHRSAARSSRRVTRSTALPEAYRRYVTSDRLRTLPAQELRARPVSPA